MSKLFSASFFTCLALLTATASAAIADNMKPLTGSVICGYQGWQDCPGDPADKGWTHWAINRQIAPSSVNFDYWPDMSYFAGCPQYPAGPFKYPDGKQATLYSPIDAQSVNVQFHMMEQHGIDGVALQCFAGGLDKPDGAGGWTTGHAARFSLLMANVQAAAKANNRTWCMEYDLSGVPAENIIPVITRHWTSLVDSGVTDSPNYLHQNGVPVVLVFGYFYNSNSHAVDFPPSSHPIGSQLVDWFHQKNKYRAFFVASGQWSWYDVTDPSFSDMMKKPDGMQGWQAGHGSPWTGYDREAKWCADNNQLWLPEIYPGFHWFNLMTNTHHPDKGQVDIDREGGRFLWRQFHEASVRSAKAAFVGMFDEFDEGTAIQPATLTPPTGSPAPDWLAAALANPSAPPAPPWWKTNPNGAQFDDFGKGNKTNWYLRLTGSAESYFAAGKTVPETIPIAP